MPAMAKAFNLFNESSSRTTYILSISWPAISIKGMSTGSALSFFSNVALQFYLPAYLIADIMSIQHIVCVRFSQERQRLWRSGAAEQWKNVVVKNLKADNGLIISSENVQNLIGTKPHGERFIRGSFEFIRAGKIGNQLGWKVEKIWLLRLLLVAILTQGYRRSNGLSEQEQSDIVSVRLVHGVYYAIRYQVSQEWQRD